MGLFDFFKGPDFNEGIETYKNTKDAVLLDVRTQEEYLEGRVPGKLEYSSSGNSEGGKADR